MLPQEKSLSAVRFFRKERERENLCAGIPAAREYKSLAYGVQGSPEHCVASENCRRERDAQTSIGYRYTQRSTFDA